MRVVLHHRNAGMAGSSSGGHPPLNGAHLSLVVQRCGLFATGFLNRDWCARRSDFQEFRRLVFSNFLMFVSMGVLRLRSRNHQRDGSLACARQKSTAVVPTCFAAFTYSYSSVSHSLGHFRCVFQSYRVPHTDLVSSNTGCLYAMGLTSDRHEHECHGCGGSSVPGVMVALSLEVM